MALFASVLRPSDASGGIEDVTKQTITTAAAGAEIVLGPEQLFCISSDTDFHLRMGQAGLGAPAVTDFYVPAGVIVTFDTGQQFSSIRLYNPTGGTGHYYVMKLSRF